MIARFVRWVKLLLEQPQPLLTEKFLSTLAHGEKAQLETLIYGYESLSESERQVPLRLLTKLHSPSFDQDLAVTEKHSLNRFSLLIIQVPWLLKQGEILSDLQPLLITKQGGELKILGYVLPWNEIYQKFSGAETETIRKLSMIWISKAIQARAIDNA
jgi:hypothetical protein